MNLLLLTRRRGRWTFDHDRFGLSSAPIPRTLSRLISVASTFDLGEPATEAVLAWWLPGLESNGSFGGRHVLFREGETGAHYVAASTFLPKLCADFPSWLVERIPGGAPDSICFQFFPATQNWKEVSEVFVPGSVNS